MKSTRADDATARQLRRMNGLPRRGGRRRVAALCGLGAAMLLLAAYLYTVVTRL